MSTTGGSRGEALHKASSKDEEGGEEDDAATHRFSRIRGSDPRVATCRGKLQNKRSKLNQEINKELRLRAGAENLYKATTNRKLRETVALELSFVNSNLQLLKEQLAELNSSVEVYQSDSSEPVMPMIPLGLKETKEVDFREPFKDFILEHYSEDGNAYEDAISEFMDIRQATRTPLRDNSGVTLLFEYYNQLYFVERRFFPPDRSLGIYFEWYDSLTGVPSCQRTVAFEKACVLFNAGALQTQLGAREDRFGNGQGLDRAVDCFLRAAGTFRYLHDHFTNAPSMDLSPNVLQMLVQLMLAQARECLFEKLEVQSKERALDVDLCLDLAQEAAQVSETYSKVHECISSPPVRDYVPHSWVALALVKREHYAALSHLHVALGMLEALPSVDALTTRTRDVLAYIHLEEGDTQLEIRVPKDDAERKLLGRAHLREAIMFHEESERLLRMCRELRGKDALRSVLRAAHDRALDAYAAAEEEDDFREILDPPRICSSTKFQLSLTPPDFAQYRVQDLFRDLGPVAIFSAKHHWTAPRNVQLRKGGGEGDVGECTVGDAGFGFSVRGDAPVIVAGVDPGSLADFGGMKEGDFIVGIGGKDVKWSPHEEVVKLIKAAGRQLSLRIVTPMDRNYLKLQQQQMSKGAVSPNSTTSSASSSSSSGVSSGTPPPPTCPLRYNSPSSSSSSNASSAGSVASGRAKGGAGAKGAAPPGSARGGDGEKSTLPWNPFRKAVALSIGCGERKAATGREEDDVENVILR
ncbi:rhophilin-2 [Ischnura elegans]|uniref:rhophilin-2 n=1 Tax=Ischnura elegans TaxID=197161 RepID=UPI001ED88CDB|nr:rhophilin-2 [Ischnura elegans]